MLQIVLDPGAHSDEARRQSKLGGPKEFTPWLETGTELAQKAKEGSGSRLGLAIPLVAPEGILVVGQE
jgi:hypothetical protein